MKKSGGPHNSGRIAAAVSALPAVPARAGRAGAADADPTARHAIKAAAAARLAASDSRRGPCPDRVAACGIRWTIDLTGMAYPFLGMALDGNQGPITPP